MYCTYLWGDWHFLFLSDIIVLGQGDLAVKQPVILSETKKMEPYRSRQDKTIFKLSNLFFSRLDIYQS